MSTSYPSSPGFYFNLELQDMMICAGREKRIEILLKKNAEEIVERKTKRQWPNGKSNRMQGN